MSSSCFQHQDTGTTAIPARTSPGGKPRASCWLVGPRAMLQTWLSKLMGSALLHQAAPGQNEPKTHLSVEQEGAQYSCEFMEHRKPAEQSPEHLHIQHHHPVMPNPGQYSKFFFFPSHLQHRPQSLWMTQFNNHPEPLCLS